VLGKRKVLSLPQEGAKKELVEKRKEKKRNRVKSNNN